MCLENYCTPEFYYLFLLLIPDDPDNPNILDDPDDPNDPNNPGDPDDSDCSEPQFEDSNYSDDPMTVYSFVLVWFGWLDDWVLID